MYKSIQMVLYIFKRNCRKFWNVQCFFRKVHTMFLICLNKSPKFQFTMGSDYSPYGICLKSYWNVTLLHISDIEQRVLFKTIMVQIYKS